MANMSTYLSIKTADYITTELDIEPDGAMTEEGQKRQYFHEYDSGDIEVVTTSNSFFFVTLSWELLSFDDADKIVDFYRDTNKANGRKRSFYWHHPIDGNVYVVRFASDITQEDAAQKHNRREIKSITLLVEGVK